MGYGAFYVICPRASSQSVTPLAVLRTASPTNCRQARNGHQAMRSYLACVQRVSPAALPVSDNCVLPTLEHSLSVGRAAVLVTGPLPPRRTTSLELSLPPNLRLCGCQSVRRPVQAVTEDVFYSDSEATALCEPFLTAPNRNILTYLDVDQSMYIRYLSQMGGSNLPRPHLVIFYFFPSAQNLQKIK